MVGCQWLGNRQHQKHPRGLKPPANHGNLGVERNRYIWCCLHLCHVPFLGRAKKTGAMQPPVLLWQVLRWPSSVGGDIWDGRYKAKAVNENHLFWSELAGGDLQRWHQ